QAFLDRELLVLVFEMYEVKASAVAIERINAGNHTPPVPNSREHANSRHLQVLFCHLIPYLLVLITTGVLNSKNCQTYQAALAFGSPRQMFEMNTQWSV